MGVRVSVVVPVYNPGEHIEPLIASLAAQTLPAEEFEAIFVDDGSTDDTPARLARLAAETPNVRVITEPNSGWPGRPRNVGTDAARGEFVFYCDNDDWLGPEALQRMTAMAVRTGADIVIGKMAGHRREVPKAIFRSSRDRAVLPETPLFDSLTPHKLFRRAFLDAHGLRFPEGRRRLEDHVLVTHAYLHAGTVSVLADYVCYHHIGRADAGNAAYHFVDWPAYYGYVRETLDLLDSHAAPPDVRTALMARTLRVELLGRLESRRFLGYDDSERQVLFEEVRRLLDERFPLSMDHRLPARQRPLAAFVRAGDLAGARDHTAWLAGVAATTTLEDAQWHDAALELRWTAQLGRTDGRLLESSDGRRRLGCTGPPAAREVTADLSRVRAEALLRTRSRDGEWLIPTTYEVEPEDTGALRLRGSCRIDPLAHAPPTQVVLDVCLRVAALGWAPELRIGATRTPGATLGARPALLSGPPPRIARPYWTRDFGNLSIELDAAPGALSRSLAVDELRLRRRLRGAAVHLRLDLCVPSPTEVTVRLTRKDGGDPVETRATLRPVDGGAALVTGPLRLAGGRWRVTLALPGCGGPVQVPVAGQLHSPGSRLRRLRRLSRLARRR